MKSEKSLWVSVSVLVAAITAIAAFVRGDAQFWCLLAAFAAWGWWVTVVMLMPYLRQAKRRKSIQAQRQRRFSDASVQTADITSPDGDYSLAVCKLIQNVNHRVTAYLHAIYPKATWEWVDSEPQKVIMEGGVGRIRVYGVDEYDHADVTLDNASNIHCSMLKVVPFSKLARKTGDGEQTPPNKQPVDPQIWYEAKGRSLLSSVIADLNSRGHSQLIIREDGDVVILQDKKEITTENLPAFPEKVYWPRLVQVLQGAGLSACVMSKGVQVSW